MNFKAVALMLTLTLTLVVTAFIPLLCQSFE